MDKEQKQYYFEMAKKNRLLRLNIDGKVIGLITFFIGNYNIDKYINRDQWSIVDDEPDGNTLYIDQLLTDKSDDNPYYSLFVWQNIKKFIRKNFSNVKTIRWNRWKNNRINIYKEELDG